MKQRRSKNDIRRKAEIFCRTTSAHGLAQFIRESSCPKRIFWMVIFIVAVIGNMTHSLLLFVQYFKYEATESSTIVNENAEFPHITICNIDPMSSTNIIELLSNKSSRTYKYDVFQREQFDTLAKTYNKSHLTARVQSWHAFYENIGEEEIRRAGHSLPDFVVHCQFGASRKECNLKEDFVAFTNPSYFNCYIYRPKQPLRVTRSGAQYGLSLILFLEATNGSVHPEVYNAFSTIGNSAGARVSIHAPSEVADPTGDGFDVLPGHSTTISLEQEFITRLSNPHGNCTEEIKTTMFGYQVPFTMCLDYCIQMIYVKKCGCKTPFLPITNTEKEIPFCGQYDPNESTENYFHRLECETEVSKRIDAFFDRSRCSCAPSCESVEYFPIISQSKWPLAKTEASFYEKYVKERRDKSQIKSFTTLRSIDFKNRLLRSNVIRSNFLRLNINYRKLTARKRAQVPSYALANLWSDVGGTFGLWAGVSVITITEVTVLTLGVCSSLCSRRRKQIREKDHARQINSLNGYIPVYKTQTEIYDISI
ncbi:unnamed protein product [Dimorphilus gyrociliatus]|uniref:Uncharacterized protein n=1 Tax=Dimorphilus gyrociliatus TaxID=2664684 RepID=A0A7I8V6F0_9ANNE|nr:unnamed protein product [Dimorphilus gyrociliatus]